MDPTEEPTSSETGSAPRSTGLGSTPEQMRQQAHRLSVLGDRREAADLLRLAVHAAEEEQAGPQRLIPLVESLAEVLWQLNEKREARLYGNRALTLYFASRG